MKIPLLGRAARGRPAFLGGRVLGKKAAIASFSIFWGPERSSGVTLKNPMFSHFLHFRAARAGNPSDARLRFRRVLRVLWRNRKAGHEGIFLVGGAARGRLAPLGCLLVAQKVVILPVFTFLGSRKEFWWHPEKLKFSSFFTFLAARGPPRGARMKIRRVLSALWRKRNASHEGICLVAGAGRGHLASLGGL